MLADELIRDLNLTDDPMQLLLDALESAKIEGVVVVSIAVGVLVNGRV